MSQLGAGRLSSIDLPPKDAALRREIGLAVPSDLRSRWTYLSGTSRRHLPPLLAELGEIDLFIHDSLHTTRNVAFELDLAWRALRRGAVVVDDVERSTGFQRFARSQPDGASFRRAGR